MAMCNKILFMDTKVLFLYSFHVTWNIILLFTCFQSFKNIKTILTSQSYTKTGSKPDVTHAWAIICWTLLNNQDIKDSGKKETKIHWVIKSRGWHTCLFVWSSQDDSNWVAMFLSVTTTPRGMLSTALKWSSYKSRAIVRTYQSKHGKMWNITINNFTRLSRLHACMQL